MHLASLRGGPFDIQEEIGLFRKKNDILALKGKRNILAARGVNRLTHLNIFNRNEKSPTILVYLCEDNIFKKREVHLFIALCAEIVSKMEYLF